MKKRPRAFDSSLVDLQVARRVIRRYKRLHLHPEDVLLESSSWCESSTKCVSLSHNVIQEQGEASYRLAGIPN